MLLGVVASAGCCPPCASCCGWSVSRYRWRCHRGLLVLELGSSSGLACVSSGCASGWAVCLGSPPQLWSSSSVSELLSSGESMLDHVPKSLLCCAVALLSADVDGSRCACWYSRCSGAWVGLTGWASRGPVGKTSCAVTGCCGAAVCCCRLLVLSLLWCLGGSCWVGRPWPCRGGIVGVPPLAGCGGAAVCCCLRVSVRLVVCSQLRCLSGSSWVGRPWPRLVGALREWLGEGLPQFAPVVATGLGRAWSCAPCVEADPRWRMAACMCAAGGSVPSGGGQSVCQRSGVWVARWRVVSGSWRRHSAAVAMAFLRPPPCCCFCGVGLRAAGLLLQGVVLPRLRSGVCCRPGVRGGPPGSCVCVPPCWCRLLAVCCGLLRLHRAIRAHCRICCCCRRFRRPTHSHRASCRWVRRLL